MVKKSIFLHLKKRLKLFCIINVFFMIPSSSFGTNSIRWNSEEENGIIKKTFIMQKSLSLFFKCKKIVFFTIKISF
jgi:hypothetical protein